MFKNKLRTKWTFLFVIVIILLVELTLRVFLGFCNAPLYVSNKNYEYIVAPNQTGKRFGNNYHFNSFSQRNNEPNPKKTTILGLGDSVLFGGVQSDQDSIATSIITQTLENYQMLNISSGSWGPDNCAAYLQEHGTFNAKAMFLVVSSHDAYDVMDFEPVVGLHSSYPNQQYKLAWWELFDRYIFPRIKNAFSKKTNLDPDEKAAQGIQKNGPVFNPGFEQIKKITDSLQIPLIVYLHAEKSELKTKKYNYQGQKIIDWTTDNNIVLIEELDYKFETSDYRDVIHLEISGQKKLAEIIIAYIERIL